jgi:hypothetical protein
MIKKPQRRKERVRVREAFEKLLEEKEEEKKMSTRPDSTILNKTEKTGFGEQYTAYCRFMRYIIGQYCVGFDKSIDI